MSTSALRHEWFQSPEYVTIDIFCKGLTSDQVSITFTPTTLSVSLQLPSGSEWVHDFDPLSHDIIPSESTYDILKTKVEIRLKKKKAGIQWSQLEGEDVAPVRTISTTEKSSLTYPTSSKKGTVNWDTLAKTSATDEKDDDNPDALFKMIYADADEDTRRAMMKSFVESQGTVLSTNWSEVGQGRVDPYKSKYDNESGSDEEGS